MKYGRLTTDFSEYKIKISARGWNVKHYKCVCDCGNITYAEKSSIKLGYIKSCGCLRSESAKARWPSLVESCKKHSKSNTRLYNIWKAMNNRCYSPNNIGYKYYGGRGITVCEEWRYSPVNFIKWAESTNYSPDLSIDRIDINGNYSPSNCRWATLSQQSKNRRPYKISHGRADSKYCYSFSRLKAKCYNPSNPSYPLLGGRGATICDEWLNNVGLFIEWAESTNTNSRTPVLDRIDRNLPFSPSNCVWVSQGYYNKWVRELLKEK
jgi:hypothetical protein